MSDPHSLTGCTIYLTRPNEDSDALDDALVHAGARVVRAPAIEFTSLIEQNLGSIRIVLQQLNARRGWLVLPSPTAIQYFAEVLSRLHMPAGEVAGLRLAVIGEASAAHLSEHGLAAAFLPPQARAQSLAEHLPGPADVPVLILGSRQTRPELREGLTRRGFMVQTLPLYAPRPCPAGLEALNDALAATDDCVLVIVTSPSGVDAIMDRHGERALRGGRFGWIGIGPTTRRRLLERGIAAARTQPATHPRIGEIVAAAEALTQRLRGEEPHAP